MGYKRGLLEYLADHTFTEGIIITSDGKESVILRFFYNFQDHEWMVKRVEE